jgi:hypothetical protein
MKEGDWSYSFLQNGYVFGKHPDGSIMHTALCCEGEYINQVTKLT